MALATWQEQIDALKEVVRRYKPYPKAVYDEMTSQFDGKSREDDKRYGASVCLDALLSMGFTEKEVNPWMNNN